MKTYHILMGEKKSCFINITAQFVRNRWIPQYFMEMKMISLQEAEFKDIPKIKVKE